MRILAITNMYPSDQRPSLGIFVEQQVAGLRKAGVDVEVLYVDRQHQGMGAYHRVPALIRSTLRRWDAHIVHVMYGGVVASLATRVVRDRPTVVSFHGSDLLGEHLSGRLRKAIAAYGVRCSWQAARRASGLVVVAKRLRDLLPRDVDRSKVRVIPCGIDTIRFRPLERSACRRELNWQGDHFRVLFNSAGDDPVKRPGLARAAVDALNRRGIKAELQELRGVSNKVVPLWLNASDVLLLTSRHEGSPTIVKEALACNLPVVSLDVGDVREQIEQIDGCYLASADPEDLAEKLRLVHSGIRMVIGHHRMEQLSLDQVAARLKAFYEDLTVTLAHEARAIPTAAGVR